MTRRKNIEEWTDDLYGWDCTRAGAAVAIEVEASTDAVPVLSVELAIIAMSPRPQRWFSEFWLAPGGRVVWVSPPID